MELFDFTSGDHNLNVPQPQPQHNNHHQDARLGLGIDLNEIPLPSAETLLDSVTNIVCTYDENPGPPSGAPTALPNDGLAPGAACSKPCPATIGSHHHLILCDNWECGFHLACECVASGVKSKRWLLE
ncbi:uncharacterized protein LOC106760307 [Vigna radiata var. radiata]|uniref:Uncharacterized protein LOC106760307 n=1 Tax=Vigna radiata var. radiata TaxID=3916 RepID=A0A1S3TZQ8_VIGRR|nr:uncharacterized protein LOC106760307 [Vigna radiata var. radiata]